MTRPHASPCMCAKCQDWARAVVGEAKPKREARPVSSVAPDMPLAEFCRRITAIACKATGLTEAQLRAKGEEMDRYWPRREIVVERVPQQHWSELEEEA